MSSFILSVSLLLGLSNNTTFPFGFDRDITIKQQAQIVLVEEVYNRRLGRSGLLFMMEAIRRESNWDQSATNTNRHKDGTTSMDWGLCQINDKYWSEFATKNGLDFRNDPFDNIRLGVYILDVQGRGAWTSMRY